LQIKKVKRAVSGVILLDKPLGLSSNQAMQRVKHLYQAEKAGHTGSLDPLATGLLPICLGEATKFANFLLDADKSYLAHVRLGIKTSTADAEGEIIQQKAVHIEQTQLQQVLKQFEGEIRQTPPIYSALKVDGKPLYAYARAGQQVEIKARLVNIHQLELVSWQAEQLVLQVTCSKGTYIRTLAQDIGEQLGCGAHLSALRRLSTGNFNIQQAYTLEDLSRMNLSQLDALLLPVDVKMQHLAKISLTEQQANSILHGQPIATEQDFKINEIIRLYKNRGEFIGLAECLTLGKLNPKRLIRQNSELSNGIA
jgi:tRNA pseudouridine55 synthase